ncbi:MAG: hypothetical protein KF895_02980 [Parvibaculum sp.]|nr:hypothetical protein [Parvibaculum sp.]
MANVNAPFGLRPHRHLGGGTIRPSGYTIADGYNTAIYTGDPVLSTGTGRNIAIGTAGGNILGVFAGCSYTDVTGAVQYRRYWPASTALKSGSLATAWVYDDPNIEFIAQAASVVAADVGQLADLASGSGNAQTGTSGWTVGTHGSSEEQVRIMGLADSGDLGGNAYGAYAKVLVLIAEHELRANLVEV